METLILKPYDYGIDGSLEYGTDRLCLKVRYDIRQKTPGIYKLCMFSSLKPMNVPVNVHTLMPVGDMATGEKEISFSELAFWGYEPNDIDTFVVYKKEKTGNIPMAACFCRLAWSFFDNPFFVSGSDDSVACAENMLERLKCAPDPLRYRAVMRALNELKQNLVPAPEAPLKDFLWYEFNIGNLLLLESAYRHMISCPSKCRLLFGVGKDGITAVASREKSVFRNVEDCLTERNGYYVAGVLFTVEGQYFARLE